jgi:hypothetical protein
VDSSPHSHTGGSDDALGAAAGGTSAGEPPLRSPRVAIIGAGMSGIGMAAKLRLAGIESFRIYEKCDELGGTWRANTYPGLTCDIPSRYYSYTFAPNPDWSRVYSPGREIWSYLDRVAGEFALADRISLGTEVSEAHWLAGGCAPAEARRPSTTSSSPPRAPSCTPSSRISRGWTPSPARCSTRRSGTIRCHFGTAASR